MLNNFKIMNQVFKDLIENKSSLMRGDYVNRDALYKHLKRTGWLNVITLSSAMYALDSIKAENYTKAKRELLLGIVSKLVNIPFGTLVEYAYLSPYKVSINNPFVVNKWVNKVLSVKELTDQKFSNHMDSELSHVWRLGYIHTLLISDCVGVELMQKFTHAMIEVVDKADNVSSEFIERYTYSTGVHFGDAYFNIIDVLRYAVRGIGSIYRVNPKRLISNIIKVLEAMYHVFGNEHGIYNENNKMEKIAAKISILLFKKRLTKWHLVASCYKSLINNTVVIIDNDDDIDECNSIPRGFYAAREWTRYFKRVPKNPDLFRNLDYKLVKYLKDNQKLYFQIIKHYKVDPEVEGHTLVGAAKAAILMDRLNNVQKIAKTKDDVHDIFGSYGLSSNNLAKDKEYFGKIIEFYLRNEIKQKELFHFLNAKDAVLEVTNGKIPATAEHLKTVLTKTVYKGIKDGFEELAILMKESGYSEWMFKRTQELMIDLKWGNHKYESIPSVTITDGEYKMTRLDKKDPMNLVIGNYIKCCQRIDDQAESSAIHAATSPDGATYVLYKGDIMIAQSWVWRDENIFVFDNIETKSPESYADRIAKMYKKLSDALIGRLGIETCIIGLGFTKIPLKRYFKVYHNNDAVREFNYPHLCYSDLRNGAAFAHVSGKSIVKDGAEPMNTPSVNL